jgi:hypothetical protein
LHVAFPLPPSLSFSLASKRVHSNENLLMRIPGES